MIKVFASILWLLVHASAESEGLRGSDAAPAPTPIKKGAAPTPTPIAKAKGGQGKAPTPMPIAKGNKTKGKGAKGKGKGAKGKGKGSVAAKPKGAPNLPSCLVEWIGIARGVTRLAQSIALQTVQCATRRGWFTEELFGNQWEWPLAHSAKNCASTILIFILSVANVVAALLGISFDCFGESQACGQVVSLAIANIVQVGALIVGITQTCPYKSIDPTLRGFGCWALIVSVIKNLLQAGKFIDVALSVCPPTRDLVKIPQRPAPEPFPLNGSKAKKGGPAPKPFKIKKGAAKEGGKANATGTHATLQSNFGMVRSRPNEAAALTSWNAFNHAVGDEVSMFQTSESFQYSHESRRLMLEENDDLGIDEMLLSNCSNIWEVLDDMVGKLDKAIQAHGRTAIY